MQIIINNEANLIIKLYSLEETILYKKRYLFKFSDPDIE